MTLLGVRYVCNLHDPTCDLTLFLFVHRRLPRFPEKIPWNGLQPEVFLCVRLMEQYFNFLRVSGSFFSPHHKVKV